MALGGACLAVDALADNALLDDQRAMFRNAWASAERGEWALSKNEQRLLEDYLLWPVLRGRYLEAALDRVPAATIDAFLVAHGRSRPARNLRYRWARHLHSSGAYRAYLRIYDAYYSELDNAELDCMAVAAQIAANEPINGALALELWHVGHSQHKACDPVFAWLQDTGAVGQQEIRARFKLALEARELGLARWLAKRLSTKEQATAARWLALRDRPATALADGTRAELAGFAAEIAYGVARLARDDTANAMQTWQALRQRYSIPEPLAARTTERIALIAAWRHEPHAADFMAQVPPAHASLELAEWRVRHALRAGDQAAVVAAIDALPATERSRTRWRYWRAVANADRDATASTQTLAALASERSYYGFLAADRAAQPYPLTADPVDVDTTLRTQLLANTALQRALELYAVGLPSRGRSEWDRAAKKLDPASLRQAALLAAEAGWADRAIAALARAGDYDALQLRYPTPWLDAFAASARRSDIALAWTYGIARSESLFMEDVRSPAGAVGVMQLMPATGRATARTAGVPFRGLATLTDAPSNIRIGTHYLAQLASRFAGHEALATAAYNAGPHRVDKWLQGAGGMPADIWVETIPFDETRAYVQRVLAARAVFHWRLTDAEHRVSQSLPPIPPVAPRIARSNR